MKMNKVLEITILQTKKHGNYLEIIPDSIDEMVL